MKLHVGSILVLSVLMLHTAVSAQESTTAAETVGKLRAELTEIQAREESLRVRAQQLDEALKPENIERALAGIGSTKPEELREHRRRQLTIERDSVNAQLKILETNRLRLEAANANAEARAYQESAAPISSPAAQMLAGDSTTLSQAFRMAPFVLLLLMFLAVIVFIFVRRAKITD